MPIILLELVAAVAFLGSCGLLVTSLVRLPFPRFRCAPLFLILLEVQLVWLSIAAAILGSILLLVVPVYSGSGASGSISSDGTTSFVAHSTHATFLQVNGPKVIPLFTVPAFLPFLVFAAFKSRVRPSVEALVAFLLAGLGISGFGLFFAPSATLMLCAGIVALRSRHTAQEAAQANAAPSRGLP